MHVNTKVGFVKYYRIEYFYYSDTYIIMQQTIYIPTPTHNGLYDITRQVEAIVSESKVQQGLVNVYIQGATAGIMILSFLCTPNEQFRKVNFSKRKQADYL